VAPNPIEPPARPTIIWPPSGQNSRQRKQNYYEPASHGEADRFIAPKKEFRYTQREIRWPKIERRSLEKRTIIAGELGQPEDGVVDAIKIAKCSRPAGLEWYRIIAGPAPIPDINSRPKGTWEC